MNKILSIVLIFSLLMSGICQQCVKAKAKAKESELVMSEDELLEVFFEVTNKWDHQYKMKVTIEMLQMCIVTLLSPVYCHHITTDSQMYNT